MTKLMKKFMRGSLMKHARAALPTRAWRAIADIPDPQISEETVDYRALWQEVKREHSEVIKRLAD